MAASETGLMITCFGEFRVEVSGHDVTHELPGRQGRALLSYLVVTPRPVARDELSAALWPADPPARPDAALGSVLAKVRRALGKGVVVGRETLALELPPGSRIDVHDLEAAVADAERAFARGDCGAALETGDTAVRVLSRPLLPSLSGEWVDAARAEFDGLKLRALDTVARAGLADGGAGALAAAEHAAVALVEQQPFREDGYALLMDTQARRGNAAEALRTFERLRGLLREELGALPSPAVVAVHERILRGRVSPARAAPGPANGNGNGNAARRSAVRALPVPTVAPRAAEGSFVGRQDCLARLRGRWDECRSGRTSLVLLVGDPGVGKTRLCARFADDVHREGGAVLYGRVDAEALLPYQPFAEALGHLIAHAGPEFAADAERELAILARSFPGLAAYGPQATPPVDGDSLRYQIFEAVVSLLARASTCWPLVVVLDDLHWADKPTLLLLQYLLRHADRRRLLVIGTFRPVDVPRDHPLKDVLSDLRRDRRYDRLELGGLDEEATHALIVDRLGREVTPALVQRLHHQSDGNAFFIEETVRALEDSGLREGAVVDADALEGLGVPEGVEEVILRRVGQLSPLAEELLMAGSVLGRSFRLGIVEHLLSDSLERVMTALEESMAAGLILEVADEIDVFTFSHALVREVLYRQYTSTRRVDLHHQVALVLERLAEREPVNPAELAHHFYEARSVAGPGPARVYSLAAGRRAAELFAYEEAVEHFRRALDLFDDDDERDRCEALLALGRVEWHAGDDHARHTFMDAAKSAQSRGAADQLAGAALGLGERYFEVTYLGSRYRELLEQAIAAVGPEDSPQRALLVARLAVNLAFPNESELGHRLAEEGVAIARRLGDEKLLAAVLLTRHVTLLDVRHLEQRLALSRELGLLASGHRELAAERHHWRMYDLLGAGDLTGARQAQAELETLAEELGQPLFRCLAYGGRGLWAELEGDIERSEHWAEASLRQARLAHTQDAVSSWASQLFAVRRRQGRVGELAPFVERLSKSGGHQLGWRSALGVLRLETGEADAARALYDEELGEGVDALPHGMFWLTRVALLSELCVKLGDVAGARSLYAALAPHRRWNIVVAYCSFWGPVEGYLGLLARAFGDVGAALDHTRAALERTRAFGAPLLSADLEARLRELTAAGAAIVATAREDN